MKPDAGKSRDKERLADKKAKKAAAKAQRKEALAPTSLAAMAALEEHLKRRRGSGRKAAFAELHRLDPERAVDVVVDLARDADGKNLAELGALLCSTGEPRFVDAAAAGRWGAVAVWEHAPQALAAAIDRLRLLLAALSVEQVSTRLASLGALPLQDVTRGASGLPGLLQELFDDERFANPALAPLPTDLGLALLEIDPRSAWQRRDRFDPALAVVAGLASGHLGDVPAAVERFIDWLPTLSPAERLRTLRQARLPASARHLGPAQAIPVLTAVLAEDALANDHPAVVRELWRLGSTLPGVDVVDRVLLRPGADFAVTVDACARLQFEEAWVVAEPLFRRSQVFRDAWLVRGHARHAALLDVVVPLLVEDPIGAAAFLGRSDDPRAALELVRAFELCPLDQLPRLWVGVMAGSPGAGVRRDLESESLERLLGVGLRGPLLPLQLEVLGVLRARVDAGTALALAVDAAVERARQLKPR